METRPLLFSPGFNRGWDAENVGSCERGARASMQRRNT